MSDIDLLLNKPGFPRSNGYPRDWVLDNQMGPNALWLAEWLCRDVPLAPGQRVLDLGCGRAMTSIFLAREFGVTVWAVDLWISPDTNWRRVVEAGLESRVFPIRSEAHALPFAAGFFDAVVSVDAYQYFGTDDLYLGYLSGFVRTGGTLGIVVPGLMAPIDPARVPEHLTTPQSNGKVFWEDECRSFKSAPWWEQHWKASDRVEAVHADTLPDGWILWRDFEQALEVSGKNVFPSDAEALERDCGRYLGFVRAVARRTAVGGENLYDASLGQRVGID